MHQMYLLRNKTNIWCTSACVRSMFGIDTFWPLRIWQQFRRRAFLRHLQFLALHHLQWQRPLQPWVKGAALADSFCLFGVLFHSFVLATVLPLIFPLSRFLFLVFFFSLVFKKCFGPGELKAKLNMISTECCNKWCLAWFHHPNDKSSMNGYRWSHWVDAGFLCRFHPLTSFKAS